MSINRGILPEELGKFPLREILQSRIIDPESSMKNIKRKNSLIFNSSSSDDYPSSHASIYEAVRISANSSEDNGHKVELITVPPRTGASTSRMKENDENSRDPRADFKIQSENSSFLYGRGTALETITEQKSIATIRSMTRSKSAEDIASSSFLRYQDSFTPSNSLRRKKSLSLDDLYLINRSYHEACLMIEQKATTLLPAYQVYARPNNPIEAPLERPRTPPGMPSWTAAQNIHVLDQEHRERSMAQNWLQRRFGFQFNTQNRYSQLAHGSKNRSPVNINSVHSNVAPRFRPPRSTYFPLNQHPFINTSIQNTTSTPGTIVTTSISDGSEIRLRNNSLGNPRKLQRVRFTPSTVMRDSEIESPEMNNRVASTAIESANSNSHRKKPTASRCRSPRVETRQNEVQCPHSKGKRNFLKGSKSSGSNSRSNRNHSAASLNNRNNLPNLPSVINTSAPQVSICIDPIDGFSSGSWARTASFSSTIPLVTTPPFSMVIDDSATLLHEEGNDLCWKCKVEYFLTRVDRLWIRALRCLCFLCGGFNIDDDRNHETLPHSLVSDRSGFVGRHGKGSKFAPRDMTAHENFL